MSATNPVDPNLEVLLTQIKEEREKSASSSRRREVPSDDILVKQILAAAADIEQEAAGKKFDPIAALGLIAARTLALTQASGVAIGLVEGDEVVCRANAGRAPDVGARIEIGKGLSGECIRTGKTVRSDDTAEDARVDPAAGSALSLRSAVLVPIRRGEEITGVFEVFSAQPNAFDDWTVLAITRVANFSGEIAHSAPPVAEAPERADAGPSELSPSDPSHSGGLLRGVMRALRQMAGHHGRIALLLLAALVMIAAAGYRVREMVKTPRPRRAAGLPAPTAPLPQPAVPQIANAQDPAVARESGRIEDGRIQDAPLARPAQPARSSEPRPRIPSPAAQVESAPAIASGPAVAELHPPEPAPRPPALAAVEPSVRHEAALAPLVSPPVADPQLAAQPAVAKVKGANPGIFTLMSRKLKGLVQRKASAQSSSQSDPQTAPSSE